MTTSENKALVERIMQARAGGDRSRFMDAMADDFVWRIIGSTAWSGEYAGKAAVRERLLKPLCAQLEGPPRITLTRLLAEGDHVVAQCAGEATTVSGARYANTYCFVIRIENGRLREMTEYLDTALVDRVLQAPVRAGKDSGDEPSGRPVS
jgi:ketosteroid isomerase-like protein